MRHYFDFEMQDVICETGEAGLTLTVNGVETRLRWDEIDGAGLAKHRALADPENVPLDVLPGLPRLARSVVKHESSKQNLLIARGGGGSRKRLFYLSVPLEGGPREQFVSELEDRLGNKWISEPLPETELRKRLGFGFRRQAVTGAIAVAIICLLVLFLMLGYQAAIETVRSWVHGFLKGPAGV